jgi:hypothetical protein
LPTSKLFHNLLKPLRLLHRTKPEALADIGLDVLVIHYVKSTHFHSIKATPNIGPESLVLPAKIRLATWFMRS